MRAQDQMGEIKGSLERRRLELEITLKRIKGDKNARPWEAEKIEARLQEVLRITGIVNA